MKLKEPIKGIFFDLGWTLLKPEYDDWFINRKVMEHTKQAAFSGIPAGRREMAFFEAQKLLDDNHYMETEQDEFEQFKEFYGILAAAFPELDLTDKMIEEMAFSKTYAMHNYIIFDDTIPTLEELKGKYKLGIISDTWPSVESILKYGNIEDFFDSKTYSYNLGIFKPDERMYLDALDKMQLPPEQTVFIDDTEKNLDGAAALGIQTVLIKVRPTAIDSGRHRTIECISELLTLL